MIPAGFKPRYFPVDTAKWTARQGITADSHGLRLAAASTTGPLGIDAVDGSAGRVTLPQGFAIDGRQRCYMVERATGTIRCFDPRGSRSGTCPFEPILRFPPALTAEGCERWSLATDSQSLYIVRPDEPCIVAVALDHWSIQEIRHFPKQSARDVATSGDAVYVLTDAAVYRRASPANEWVRTLTLPTGHNCERLIVDLQGNAFVCLPNGQILPVTGGQPQTLDRSLFAIPAVITTPATHVEAGFQYIISPDVASPAAELMAASDEETHKIPAELSAPKITRDMLDCQDLSAGFVIHENGSRVRKIDAPATRLFSTGTGLPNQEESLWFSTLIDSYRYRCRWDRVEFEALIPTGSKVVVSTVTFDEIPANDLQPDQLADPVWSDGIVVNAGAPSPHAEWQALDFLVRSHPGRYLCLRIQLFGDGFSTPVIRNVMARGPRQSYVDFLPSVMREDDVSRDFLERFLAVFQTEWDRMESNVETMDRMFNPAQIPDLQLGQLARRLGIPLPEGWNPIQSRRLLTLAPQLLMAAPQPAKFPGDESTERIGGCRRGTVGHIRDSVRAILAGLTGLTEDQMLEFPRIIEGHRERRHFQIGAARESGLGQLGVRVDLTGEATLWGPDTTGRLQLGDNSVLGERKLLPNGQQELDLFRAYAHRIRVVVPACWVRTPEDVCVLKTMLDAEKPAHVVSEIQLVEPGMRLGLQSTLGVDTILGDWPEPVLGEPASLGLGQGLVLPSLHDERPPPMTVDTPLDRHSI